MFGLRVERCRVTELDSTTPAKFSRHLVLRLGGEPAAFESNAHAGAFVAAMAARVSADATSGGRFAALQVATSSGASTTFFDQSVYSRNRCGARGRWRP